MFIAYIAAAVLCSAAASQCRPVHGIAQRERRLWQALAVVLATLAIYRQLDLAELITGLGRSFAIHGKWYAHRRPIQGAMVGVFAAAVSAAAFSMLQRISAVDPHARTAFAASTMLVLLLGINVLSLHWIDTFFHSGYRRVTVYDLIEAGSLATILTASWGYRPQAMVVSPR